MPHSLQNSCPPRLMLCQMHASLQPTMTHPSARVSGLPPSDLKLIETREQHCCLLAPCLVRPMPSSNNKPLSSTHAKKVFPTLTCSAAYALSCRLEIQPRDSTQPHYITPLLDSCPARLVPCQIHAPPNAPPGGMETALRKS